MGACRNICVVLAIACFSSLALSDELEADLRLMDQRYQDFFSRLAKDQAAAEQRERAGEKNKQRREEEQKAYDRARREYKKERGQIHEASSEAAEAQDLKQRAQEQKKRDQARSEYAGEKARLYKLEKSKGHLIPEDVELGLRPEPEDTEDDPGGSHF